MPYSSEMQEMLIESMTYKYAGLLASITEFVTDNGDALYTSQHLVEHIAQHLMATDMADGCYYPIEFYHACVKGEDTSPWGLSEAEQAHQTWYESLNDKQRTAYFNGTLPSPHLQDEE